MTKAEEEYQNRLANIVGCCICRFHLSFFNDYVSIHHIDGRTKPGCQLKVLPLCGPHHQTGGEGVALHSFKKTWERRYGTQYELKKKCDDFLDGEKD